MTLPLYRHVEWPKARDAAANAGLWHEKYVEAKWGDPGEKTGENSDKKTGEKTKWLKTFTGQPVGDASLLEEHATRRAALVTSRGGFHKTLTTEGRFVSGLGQTHPVENGFCWHRSLGVPYLPGSGVKGMVRAWAENWAGGGDHIPRIFGPKAKDVPLSVGSVVFLDALPLRPVQLEVDVMTPHYAPYYKNQGQDVLPGDWHSPVPVPFLTVAGKQSFSFALLPRSPETTREDLDLASGWLIEALTWLGAGAKTAVGYGRFVEEGIKTAPPQAAAAVARRPRPGGRGMYLSMPSRVVACNADGTLEVSIDGEDGTEIIAPEEFQLL